MQGAGQWEGVQTYVFALASRNNRPVERHTVRVSDTLLVGLIVFKEPVRPKIRQRDISLHLR